MWWFVLELSLIIGWIWPVRKKLGGQELKEWRFIVFHWPLSPSWQSLICNHLLSIYPPCCDSEADLSFSLPVSVSSHFLIIIHSLGPSSHQLSLYPSSVQLLQDAQASEGQVVVLECRVRGSPPLQVRWYRQGEEILDSPDFRILQKSETFLLVIISGY